MEAPLKEISEEEKLWSQEMSSQRAKEYQHSRGYVRYALSNLWDIPSLSIPLHAEPGMPPLLPDGWGHVSFSHCCDALLIGWFPDNIGVDIERADRSFNAAKLSKRYFAKDEQEEIKTLKEDNLRIAVLEKWVIKEASIKWQKGNIGRDISQWKVYNQGKHVRHESLGYKINLEKINILEWKIAVTYTNHLMRSIPILCIN